MPDDQFTPVQRSVLLILMAEARELPNADLTNHYRLKFDKKLRDDLNRRGLITVRVDGRRRVYMEITDAGFRWCGEQDGSEVPAGVGSGGAAAYALLAGLRRNLRRLRVGTLPELFMREAEAEPVPEPVPAPVVSDAVAAGEIEARIRKSYLELAGGPGDWVKLASLRPLLGDLARPDVDRVLVEMNRTPGVSIVPESNQKVLSEEDRAAAVRIGNQDKHLIAIGPS